MTAIAFIIFIAGLILGFPIAVGMGLGAIAPGLISPVFPGKIQYILRAMVVGVDSSPIIAIPLFMLSGTIMAKGGISKRLFDIFACFAGRKTAGMPIAVIITCLFYGTISGSGPATTAAVGAMTIPVLVSLGYDKIFSAAIVTVAGGLGLIIPPSISYIMYGVATGTSVGSMFIAGIFPGILIAAFLCSYAYIYCKRNGEDKLKIAANHDELKKRGYFRVFLDGIWAVLTPIFILGAIYGGIATPTEAACISVFYALFVSLFAYKTIAFKDVWKLIVDSVNQYAPLLVLIALATAFSRVLTFAKAPQVLASALETANMDKIAFLIILNVILLILGMFIDGAPAILILAPMLVPIAAKLGINPIHLGMIMVVNLTLGLATPPFGLNLFVASPLVKTPVMALGKKAMGFIIANILALLIITFVPEITMVLVK